MKCHLLRQSVADKLASVMKGNPGVHQSPSFSFSNLVILLCLAVLTSLHSFAAFSAGFEFEVPFLVRKIDGSAFVTNRTFHSTAGPLDGQRLLTGMRLVQSGADGVFIGIDRSTVLRVSSNGLTVNESSGNPELADWSMGVTFDSQAQRVVLVTLGGEGALYQRTPSGEWSTIASMQNEDLESLVHLATDNNLYGIEVYNGAPTVPATLMKYSSTGERLGEIALPPFPVNLSPGGHTAKLVAVDGKIIALVERDPQQQLQVGDHSRIYVIDPATGTADLTYDHVVEATPPPKPPTIVFTQPSNDDTFTLGSTTTIVLQAGDPDGDLRFVDLYDGSTSLRKWVLDPGPNKTNELTLAWTPTVSGSHSLRARATDVRGNVAEATVGVRVVEINSQFTGWYFKNDAVIAVSYGETGPTDGGTLYRGLPVAQAGNYYLGRDNHTIFRWDNEHDVYTETSPGVDFSWPRGTTFDTKRNRFIVVTLVGEGNLYAVTPATLQWSTIASMNNVDVDSVVYNFNDDLLYMVENHGGTVRILRYNAEGQQQASVITIPEVPLEIGSYYQSRLIMAGHEIALLVEPTPGWNPAPPVESRIYMIDPVSNTSRLTYRKVWTTWPPKETPAPTIAITAPTNNTEFPEGKGIVISARGNVEFANVAIYLDGQKIGDAHQSNVTVYPPFYGLTWSNAPAGDHTLIAIGQTSSTICTSAPVHIRVIATPPVLTVERDLPGSYAPGAWLTVTLNAKPGAGVNAWAVEETPPAGWQFGEASQSGVFDQALGKIKWGPFTDTTARALTYTIRPPTNSTGSKSFTGVFSLNGAQKPITGDTTISDALAHHPADAPPEDNRITVNELTAYAAAWKSGAKWPRGPATIPIEYVTRAGQIWKSGETYRFDPSLNAPACWIPVSQQLRTFSLATDLSTSGATRVLPPAFSPGHTVPVSVTVRPVAGVQNYAVEEQPPAGCTIVDAAGATIAGGTLRYGPFYDAQERTFVYHVVSSGSAPQQFGGRASFDGSKDAIGGAAILSPPTTSAEQRDGRVYLRFNATPGEQFILESASAIDSAPWEYETTIQGADTAIELPPFEPSSNLKFYRLRPAP